MPPAPTCTAVSLVVGLALAAPVPPTTARRPVVARPATRAAAPPAGTSSATPAEPAPELKKAWIAVAPDASAQEELAAREIRRYVYQRTGRLLPITSRAPATGRGFVISRADRPFASERTPEAVLAAARDLGPQGYCLERVSEPEESPTREVLFILGGDETGTLYGAYRAAELLGVRFALHGDVVPERPIDFAIPEAHETARPLFALRGILPFHDFPEGPDWWGRAEYRSVLAQLPKLRMNFFGLHTYPEGRPHAEPTVWIGTPEDLDAQGRVGASYPASYNSTARGAALAGNWGYRAKPTSEFLFGGALLFRDEVFGSEVQAGALPLPVTPADANQVFDRTAALLADAFARARALGIQTCVGTETPLVVPSAVRERLAARGLTQIDPAVTQRLYEGAFQHALRTYRPDFFWLWTPEAWTWEGEQAADVAATLADLQVARRAVEAVGAPFRLATCGWVLGPRPDRALFDRTLPKDMPFSCINRKVGKADIDPGFARLEGRDKWAIPWLEDDPALTAAQLWVGRVRRDAEDARRYGCTGLLGIHWRTRNVAPQAAMLARAGWSQDWERAKPETLGALGGYPSDIHERGPVAGADEDALYQDVRVGMSAYRFALPKGTYRVTLKLVEPTFGEAGRRVFDVVLQGRTAAEAVDIAARAGGAHKALDLSFDGVEVGVTPLEIRFDPRVGMPAVAALVVAGPVTRRVNCGGPAVAGFVADDPVPTVDFYRDWVRAELGPEVLTDASALFARIDGRLPAVADWTDGPGGLRPDARPWSQVAPDFAFVDELGALAPRVKGPAARERLGYWLAQFRTLRAMARLRCAWGLYERAVTPLEKLDPGEERQRLASAVLPLRRALAAAVAEVYRHLLAGLGSAGERGTLANWELRILPSLPLADPRLTQALGHPLPDDLGLTTAYAGATRVILPTPPLNAQAGDRLRVEVLVLSAQPPRQALLHWRPMGIGEFRTRPLTHVARGVYEAVFPLPVGRDDLEYYVVDPALDGKESHGDDDTMIRHLYHSYVA